MHHGYKHYALYENIIISIEYYHLTCKLFLQLTVLSTTPHVDMSVSDVFQADRSLIHFTESAIVGIILVAWEIVVMVISVFTESTIAMHDMHGHDATCLTFRKHNGRNLP